LYALMLVQSAGGGFGGLLLLLPMFAIFYFLLILPQQKRQKKWQAMLSQIKNGDRVTTSGGLRGTIIALRDDAVHLRVPPDNIKVEIARNSIVSVTTDEVATTK